MKLLVNFTIYVYLSLLVCHGTVLANQHRRIVAMGDLHGDLDNTLEILKFAKVINNQHRWIGDDTIFVQTGDVLDRGNDTIKLFKLIQELREEAPLYGGLVVPLLGNHEIMNLKGDWKYVRPGEIDSFGDIKSRKEAFSENGFIGRYLIPLNITTKIGSTVFCHGGITSRFARHGIDWINDQVHSSIIEYMGSRGKKGDKYGVFGSQGPTWYRGYARDEESEACPALEEVLSFLDAKRMVVGHTVQPNGLIHTRCSGKIILIDIGISKVYGRHKGALEIRGEDVFAIYPNRREALSSPSPIKTFFQANNKNHIEL